MPKRNKANDYIDKAKFSNAVEDYVCLYHKYVNEGKTGDELPRISDYIAECFMLLAENISHRPNFVGYTYREDMVMDAFENCLRYVHNYNPNAETKSGKPNAFGYFTRICYFAMVRRIKKENAFLDFKKTLIEKSSIYDFVEGGEEARPYIDQLKNYHSKDQE